MPFVGRSWQTAYRLRSRPGSASFAAAWDAALAPAPLPVGFTGRAIGGAVRPIVYSGRQVGERRRYDNRLAKFILRLRTSEHHASAPGSGRDFPST